MKTFDLVNTPLAGTNIIEAGAGTGKTYTIAGLFLRLILESHLSVDQILVVTFTRAATAELKERIYSKLLQAKEAFLRGSSNDILISALVKKYDNKDLAIRLIQDALIDFDRSAIFTMHGFCQRVLHENTIETGSLFDTQLMIDQAGLIQEVVDDFWRKHLYTAPEEFISYSIEKVSGPEYFLKLLSKARMLDIKVIPDIRGIRRPTLKNLDNYRDYRTVFKRLRDVWRSRMESASNGLKDLSLYNNVYGSPRKESEQPGLSERDLKVASMVKAMDRFVNLRGVDFPLFKNFEKFTSTKLKVSVKKNHSPPTDKLFDVADELYVKGTGLEGEMEKYLLFLKVELFRFARSQLAARKRIYNIQFFDDFLTMVKEAICKNGKNELVKGVRQKYRAALVDEFQDTDPVQYKILAKLFSSEGSILFMIGDPKQAIYSFRGADIFSYLKAKAACRADSKYTLTENWRSSPGLITAVNSIFSSAKRAFVFDEIPFEEGRFGGKIESFKEKSPASIKLWFLKSEGDRPVNKTEAVELIARHVASEISSLISDDKDCTAGRVEAGDIAVLVRTNRQARIVKKSLSAKRIPSVLYGAGNIFDSHEAMEMERALLSISEPNSERLFRAALVTDMMGIPGEELDLAEKEPVWWEGMLANFTGYFRLWSRCGFIRMFRSFMAKERIKSRLLSFPDGERRLTNLLHLTEILHQKSIEKKLGIKGLIKWLSEQMDRTSFGPEEHQLRLESDEHAVKIVTIHKSKGLEYPIVFCPFGWEGSLIRKDEIVFHDDKEKRITLDLSSDKESSSAVSAQNELLAENLRLLYVALTRAKMRCYLVWGRINTAETSAMAYLFHHRDAIKEEYDVKDDIVASLKRTFKVKGNNELLNDLTDIVRSSKGSIELVSLPFEDSRKYKLRKYKEEKLACRKFSETIDTTWRTSSYSSLVSGRAIDGELLDRNTYYDRYWHRQDDQSGQPGRADIFSFPKGALAGTFFHDIFEHLDFTPEYPACLDCQKRLVEDKLREYDFEPRWQEPVLRMIKNVLSAPLLKARDDLILSSVQCKERINEMEFYFPLKSVTPQRLKWIFADYGGINIPTSFPDRLERLTFLPAKGFMKGYIDMIFRHNGRFYLVDWKSNFLGAGVEDYDRDSLNRVMESNFYLLQYHIYTLALHQYLRMRIPGYSYETDFGGLFYIFIRGVNANRGPEFGIYSDLPGKDLIEGLGKSLIPGF